MKLIRKGWYCPECEALIHSKRYQAGIITCDCYEIAGANICMPDSKKDQIITGEKGKKICWYEVITKTQKFWKGLYLKIEEKIETK